MADDPLEGTLVTLTGKVLVQGIKRSREDNVVYHKKILNLKTRVLENGSLRLWYQETKDDCDEQRFAARTNHWRPIVRLVADRNGLLREENSVGDEKDACDSLVAQRNEQIAAAKTVTKVPFKWTRTVEESSVVLPPAVPVYLPVLWSDPIIWLPASSCTKETIRFEELQADLEVDHEPNPENTARAGFNVYGVQLELYIDAKSCYLYMPGWRKSWYVCPWDYSRVEPWAVVVDHKIYFFLDSKGTPSCFDLMFPERLAAMRSLGQSALAYVSDQTRYLYALHRNFVYCFDTVLNRWDCLFHENQYNTRGSLQRTRVVGDWIFVVDYGVRVLKACTKEKSHGWWLGRLEKPFQREEDIQWTTLQEMPDAAWRCLCKNAECSRMHEGAEDSN